MRPGRNPQNSELTCESFNGRKIVAVEPQQGQYYTVTSDEEPMPLMEYWPILLRGKWIVLSATILGVLAAVLYTIPQTPIYQARASVEIQNFNENYLNMKNVDPTASSGYAAADAYFQTQIQILKSRTLVGRVIDRLNLDKRPEFTSSQGDVSRWRELLGLPQPGEMPARERALNRAIRDLSVKGTPNTRIAEIKFDSTDAQLAADFLNVLSSEYVSANLEGRLRSTEGTSSFLNGQIKELKIQLEKSEDGLQNYARANGLMFTSEKDSVAEEKLRQYQAELSKAQADRVNKQSQFELTSSSPVDTLADVVNDATLRDYQVKLTDLHRQVAELGSLLTPAHSRVQRLTAQVSQLEAAQKAHRMNIIRRVRNDFDAALRREKLLEADYANQVRLVTNQSAKSVHYNILKREVDTNRQLYESMLQSVKEAGVASAMRASNVRVVDAATVPSRPYKPNHLLSAVLGFLFGTLIGVGVVILREVTDRRLQDVGDAAFYLGIPELGAIPGARFGVSAGSRDEAVDPVRKSVELAVWKKRDSLFTESFHTTLTSIMFSRSAEPGAQLLVFTSPNPGEGKTTVATNLALALAQVNQRVLLIDGDMRRPRLHSIFSLENGFGLSGLLRQSDYLDEDVISNTIQDTEVPGLWVLPSGPTSKNTHNLLYSARATELLQGLRPHFDVIIVDTPPMLQMSDARVIGRLADTVILVLRMGKTTRDAAVAARRRFQADGTEVLGFIANDWNPKRASSYNPYEDAYSVYQKRPAENC